MFCERALSPQAPKKGAAPFALTFDSKESRTSGSEQGTPRAITDLDAPPRVRGDDDGDGRGFESPRVFFREVICARATPATFLIDGFCYILE